MELAAQAYEAFFNLFTSEQFGPERSFKAAVSEHPISMFMSEPKSFQAILEQPPEIRRLWLKAAGSELDNLISNETFQLEQPLSNDQVIPTILVLKCKSKSDGTMEKLKA
eukprot:10475795-Ditylum_brightwellii.AAC.2